MDSVLRYCAWPARTARDPHTLGTLERRPSLDRSRDALVPKTTRECFKRVQVRARRLLKRLEFLFELAPAPPPRRSRPVRFKTFSLSLSLSQPQSAPGPCPCHLARLPRKLHAAIAARFSVHRDEGSRFCGIFSRWIVEPEWSRDDSRDFVDEVLQGARDAAFEEKKNTLNRCRLTERDCGKSREREREREKETLDTLCQGGNTVIETCVVGGRRARTTTPSSTSPSRPARGTTFLRVSILVGFLRMGETSLETFG